MTDPKEQATIDCREIFEKHKEEFTRLVAENVRNNSTFDPCDELETILWGNSVALSRPHDPEVWNRTVASCPRPFYTAELVTRQNAEEVIAAERMKLEATAKVGLQLTEQIETLEADNKRLLEALIKISRGSYDDLEVTSLSAKQMKDIANAVLAEVKP